VERQINGLPAAKVEKLPWRDHTTPPTSINPAQYPTINALHHIASRVFVRNNTTYILHEQWCFVVQKTRGIFLARSSLKLLSRVLRGREERRKERMAAARLWSLPESGGILAPRRRGVERLKKGLSLHPDNNEGPYTGMQVTS
jgi:hypothetical protein